MKIDPALLSAFADHEVPSPWKEKLEKLVQDDSEVGRDMDEISRVKRSLQVLTEPHLQDAKDRVWQKIQQKIQGRPRVVPLTKRRVILSFPLAAAAAFLVSFGSLMSGIVIANASQSSQNQKAQIAVETLRSLSREDVLALMSKDEISEVQVTLPSSVNLKVKGEGQLMRVSNYTGGDQ